MTRISRRHPRYESLRTRAQLAAALRTRVVVAEGLIAHGRGEAFDYYLGERTTRSARGAERLAARWLLAARHPVICVNGNVAALAAPEVVELARRRPGLGIEVNLFHRTAGRAHAVAQVLERAGARRILGVRASARIPGLPSDRARVDRQGVWRADVCLIPLEDGDRTMALRRLGKRVIAIDLNPFSRTSEAADLPIIDELRRALRGIARGLSERRPRPPTGVFESADAAGLLAAARATMAARLIVARAGRSPAATARPASPRPALGSARRWRRTPAARSRRHRSPR